MTLARRIATAFVIAAIGFGVSACHDNEFTDVRSYGGTIAIVERMNVLADSDYTYIYFQDHIGTYMCRDDQDADCASLRSGQVVEMVHGTVHGTSNRVIDITILLEEDPTLTPPS